MVCKEFFMNTKGITIAGNILTDKIKLIDAYPQQGMLCNISKVEMGVGGAVPNTIIDLAVLDPTVPLKAVGLVGDDAEGRFAVGMMKDKGVDGINNTLPFSIIHLYFLLLPFLIRQKIY